jgi:hypothetical protein
MVVVEALFCFEGLVAFFSALCGRVLGKYVDQHGGQATGK